MRRGPPNYRGTSLMRNRPPLGPYSSICLGPYGGPMGGGAIFYERGAPVDSEPAHDGRPGRPQRDFFMYYRATLLIGTPPPIGSYSSICPGPYGGPMGGGQFLMSEVPLYYRHSRHTRHTTRRVHTNSRCRGYSELRTRTVLGSYSRAINSVIVREAFIVSGIPRRARI